MGNKKSSLLVRTIKYLALCREPRIILSILRNSPENLIKSICNAAANAAKGSVVFNRDQKKALAKHRNLITHLIQKGEGVKQKRKILLKQSETTLKTLIPALLDSVLSSLGTTLFTRNGRKI